MEPNGNGSETCVILPQNLNIQDPFCSIVVQSPISTWIADKCGTCVFANKASLKLFGIDRIEDAVGKYNIFRDEELSARGVMPQIRKIFETGGSGELINEYDISRSNQFNISTPNPKIIRAFMFAIKDDAGRVQYVVIQQEDYTERVRIEKSLVDSETRFRELVEEVSDWVWAVDSEGRYTYSSPVVENILGYKVEDIIGKSAFDFIVRADRKKSMLVFHTSVTNKTEIFSLLNRHRRKDGSVFYLEKRGKPIFDEAGDVAGFRGVGRDVTDRERALRALRRSEENFRSIFDYTPAGILAYDRKAIIVQANVACERLYGFSQKELVGKSVFDTIISPENRDQFLEAINRVFSGESVEDLEWLDVRADGTTICVMRNTTPVYNEVGEIVMGLSLNVDITELRMAERRRLEFEQHKQEFYRRTIFAATQGKLVISTVEEIEALEGSLISAWNVTERKDVAYVRHIVRRLAEKAGMDKHRIEDLEVIVGEATTNAIKHGDGGQAGLYSTDDSLLFVVSDKGPGIEALILPEATLMRGYSTVGSLGMGYKTIISYADRVYLATGQSGTTLAIEMKLHSTEPTFVAANLPDTWSMSV